MFIYFVTLRRWFICLCLIASLSPLSSQAAQKIILLADTNSSTQQAAARGFLSVLGQEFNVTQKQYPLGEGYSVEIETNANNLVTLSQNSEVLALICTTSLMCLKATEANAAKDLLVISLTATSTDLSFGENIARMAPSNASQSRAIYKRLKEGIATGRFAVIYEPDAYGADLYENFIFSYVEDIVLGNTPPQWVAGLPLHSYLSLQTSQKDNNATKILNMFSNQKVDAVVYLGSTEGFLDLTDKTRGGNPNVATRWYAGDALSSLATEKAFTALEIIGLFGSGRDEPTQYYYGYDAADFLVKVAVAYLQQGGGVRSKLLEIAKTVSITGKTGVKSFDSSDTNPLFTLMLYQSDGALDTTVISGTRN